jgi:hypothetical protein
MTKARTIADLGTGFVNISDTGTEGTKVASGTTAQRGSTTGQLRFNTTTGLAEYYTGTIFKAIDAPPTISSLDVTEVDSQAGGNQTIVITGSNFSSGATVTFLGASGTDFNASTVTVNSDTQITAVAPKASFLNAQEPYGVKVENTSGLSATLASQINVDSLPSWNTASGNIGTVYEDVVLSSALTPNATDPDGDTIVYSVNSGSLPTGLSLNSANGQITGTPNVNDTYASGGVTHTFDLRATANSKTSDRTFNIIRRWLDGSSSALAVSSPQDIRDLGITTDGLYYLDPDGGGASQFDCKFNIGGGNYGFALAMVVKNPFFFGQMLLNNWNGHTGQSAPVYSSTATTYNNDKYSYMPDNAGYVLLAWHDNYTSNFGATTDYVHTTTVGSPASNTGFWATSSHNASYTPSSVVAYSVSGWSNTSGATWHFRDHPSSGYDYLPRGFSRGLGHNTQSDSTNDLLGSLADGCSNFTSQSGAGNLYSSSETYVGNRKNIDNSGAGGSYCSLPSSGNNDGWSMWWR